jgi:hypothetical protein
VSGLAITSKSVVVNPLQPDGEEDELRSRALPEGVHLGAEDADRFVADARALEAIESARRSRWARQILEESTTVLAALHASLGKQAFLILRTGERRGVEISALGEDFVQVRTATSLSWIRLACVIAIEANSSVAADPTAFDPADGLIVEVLEDLVADELQITLGLVGGAKLTGVAISVGAALRLEVPDLSYVAVVDIDNIETITLPLYSRG